jgi:hypothetical protein
MGSDIDQDTVGVRIITGAPEVEGVMHAIAKASKRGICFNIGHRLAPLSTSADDMCSMANVVSARRTWLRPRSEMAHGVSPTCSMRCPSYTIETPRSSVCWAPHRIPLLAQHPTLLHSRVPRQSQGLPQGRVRRLPTHRRRSTRSRRHGRHLGRPSSATSDSRLPSDSLPSRDPSMRLSWTVFTPTQTLSEYAWCLCLIFQAFMRLLFQAGILCTP